MSWNDVKVDGTRRAALPAFEIVTALAVDVEWIHERATLLIYEESPLDTLEEFIVRCLMDLEPAPDDERVKTILGLPHVRFVTQVTSRLEGMRLLERDTAGRRRVVPALAEQVAARKSLVTKREPVDCWFEPGTRRRASSPPGKLSQERRPQPPQVADDVGLLRWARSAEGPWDGKSAYEVEDYKSSEVATHTLEILIYEDAEQLTWGWEVYDAGRGRIAPDLRELLKHHGAQEAAEGSLASSVPAEKEPEVVELPRRIGHLKTLVTASPIRPPGNRSSSIERLTTRPAAQRIVDVIRAARHEVLMVFPWIKGGGVDRDFVSALETAARNGTRIYIGYGIGSQEDEVSHADVIDRLQRIPGKDGLPGVLVVWIGNTHNKECSCDGEHYLSGSLNRLSFRGESREEGVPCRREVMLHIRGQDAKPLIAEFRAEFAPLIADAVLPKLPPASALPFADWRRAFIPLLLLLPSERVVRAALASAPEKLEENVRALQRVFLAAVSAQQTGGFAGVAALVVGHLIKRLDAVGTEVPKTARADAKTLLGEIRKANPSPEEALAKGLARIALALA